MLNKRGFTLVELAIVLVVIGMILGMAIKGKALLDAASLRSDMAKINKIVTAVALYSVNNNFMIPDLYNSADCRFNYKEVYKETLTEKDWMLTSFNMPIGVFEGRVRADGALGGECAVTIEKSTLTITAQDITKDYPYTLTLDFKKRAVCYIEVMLDDESLNSGQGRIVLDASASFPGQWKADTYANCNKIPLTDFTRYGYLLPY